MLSAEQVKLLEGYRDKAYICNVLYDESYNYYSFTKTLINLPLILSSTIMTVLNSSDFDPMTMRRYDIFMSNKNGLSVYAFTVPFDNPFLDETKFNEQFLYRYDFNRGSSWPCGQGGGLAVVRSPVRTLPPREIRWRPRGVAWDAVPDP
jgi:hypothetical protein